jgi:sulfotransferase family protein
VGLRLEATLGLRVVLDGGERIDVGSVTVRRQPLRTDYEPRLSPLLVTSLGRSGTTLLMKMLACHPEVVVFRRFPYESAPAKYWLHMLKVLAEPANLAQSAHPETFFGNFWWIGSNPFHDELVARDAPLEQSLGRDYVERLAAFCQRSIDDWYTALARRQEQPGAVLFAEKHLWPNYLPVLTWELYPSTKEVFLVRDFRDMALSAMQFGERRGFGGYPGPDGEAGERYVRNELRKMALDLRKSWRSRGARGHLVRYEDLITAPAETLAALFDYLEVDASAARVGDVIAQSSNEELALPGASQEPAEVGAHRAVLDPKDTIGRWSRDGGDVFKAIAQETFADVLEDFGYDP